MTFPNHNPDDGIESYQIPDADGDLYATITYFMPKSTPSHPFDCWVVDFRDGQRITGELANEVAKRLMADPGTAGVQTSQFAAQADSILDTVVYDDHGHSYRIEWGGNRIWFKSAADEGDSIVLYESKKSETRAGKLESPPFDADELKGAMNMARTKVNRHV